MKTFSIEFTDIDRLAFQVRIQNNQLTGLRVTYQVYKRTDRVVYDMKGFEPFNVGDWTTIVKYDNFKGEAHRDAMRLTPVTHSPFGLHMKESWGYLDVYQMLEKVLEDVKKNWQQDHGNYGKNLPALAEERTELARRNFPFTEELSRYILHDRTLLEQIDEGLGMMPMPKAGLDDWVIEQNTFAMNRIEKLALRGKLSIEQLGRLEIVTHRPRAEGENIEQQLRL